MASLSGLYPSNTFQQLLQIGSANTGLTASLQAVQDGSGAASLLSLSTTQVAINSNVLSMAAALTITSATTLVGAGNTLTLAGTASISGTNTGDQTTVSGNAGTVTTNANLTGVVTSVGNATSIANSAITNAMLANTAVANLSGTNSGNQTITLTGGVTGSGTGSFAATVVTNANLTGDVTSSGNTTTLVGRATKWWVDFVGSNGTISASYGVGVAVVRNSTGNYTITTPNMGSNLYCLHANASSGNITASITAGSPTSATVLCFTASTGSAVDPGSVCASGIN